MSKKSDDLRVRIEPAMKVRLQDAYDGYGVAAAVLARDAMEAALDYIEREGAYRKPLRVEWAGAAAPSERQWVLNEQPPAPSGGGGVDPVDAAIEREVERRKKRGQGRRRRGTGAGAGASSAGSG